MTIIDLLNKACLLGLDPSRAELEITIQVDCESGKPQEGEILDAFLDEEPTLTKQGSNALLSLRVSI